MSIPFWCVFISALLIYVARMPVGKAMKEQGGYNNHLPRQQQTQLTGYGARALAAHQNSIEAFILFAVGVLMAHTTQTAGWLIDALAIILSSRESSTCGSTWLICRNCAAWSGWLA
jgi:uncharacterized MAPEG superfamily protein